MFLAGFTSGVAILRSVFISDKLPALIFIRKPFDACNFQWREQVARACSQKPFRASLNHLPAKNDESKICRKSRTVFSFFHETISSRASSFDWPATKERNGRISLAFERSLILLDWMKSPPLYFARTIFAVELSTGKGRLILKDFIVVGEKRKNSWKVELAAE